jgi:SAM-dependent methyltransferase
MVAESFIEAIVRNLHNSCGVVGQTVLQIMPMPSLDAAKLLRARGAARVIVASAYPGRNEVADGVETLLAAPQRVAEMVGEEAVDAVLAYNLLDKLDDIPAVMTAICRVLKPGGVCLLQGQPIWTSSRGHHLLAGRAGVLARFWDESNPIPLWGHLYLTEEEMRHELAAAGHPEDIVTAAIDWAFKSRLINRVPRRRIIDEVWAGPLLVKNFWETADEKPDATALSRIREGAWWDPEEDYGTRDLTFVLWKPKRRRYSPSLGLPADDAQSQHADLDRLYNIAKYSLLMTNDIRASLPHTLEAQHHLVNLLSKRLRSSSLDLRIEKDFVCEILRIDREFCSRWETANPDHVAWLMVHEELSDFFPLFAIAYFKPDVYIVHHVPKCGGQSVNKALADSSCFVSFPQPDFDKMLIEYGLLGFASQLFQFEREPTKLYVGGHFNLLEMITRLGIRGLCNGVTLTRPPLALLSSAVRFVWMMIEQKDRMVTSSYPDLQPDRLRQARVGLWSGGGAPSWSAADEIAEIARAIVTTPQFQSEYHEIYKKYFYGKGVNSPAALAQFLASCGQIFPVVNLEQDRERLFQQLKVPVAALPRENVSVLTHADLALALGGETAVHQLLGPHVVESSAIYDVLCRHRETMLRHS